MAVKSPNYSDDTGRELCRISDGLYSAKQRWDSLCQELAENYYPMRADFTTYAGDDMVQLLSVAPTSAK